MGEGDPEGGSVLGGTGDLEGDSDGGRAGDRVGAEVGLPVGLAVGLALGLGLALGDGERVAAGLTEVVDAGAGRVWVTGGGGRTDR